MHIMPLTLVRYGVVMAVELHHLRALVAVIDTGTFTDAAIDLGISQAAVSRSLQALERELGIPLVRRGPRHSTPTPTGRTVADIARRILAETDNLVEVASSGRTTLRLGYAWAGVGARTVALQRRWADEHPEVQLHLIRSNTPTAGLAEGRADAAIVRIPLDAGRYETVVVGLERRLAAVASDDPWARRRSLRMAEISRRTVLVDSRTGTTSPALWPEDQRPASIRHTGDVDEWLDAIAAGEAVGTTAEATAAQYPRPGVSYRPIVDGPRIPVVLAWHRHDPPPGISALAHLLTALYEENTPRRTPAPGAEDA